MFVHFLGQNCRLINDSNLILNIHSKAIFFYRSRTFSKKNEVAKFLRSWIGYFLKIENFGITKIIYKNILMILHFSSKLGGSIVTAHLNFLMKDVDAISICAFVYSFLASCGYLTIGTKVNPDILLDYEVNIPKVMFGFISMAVKTVFPCKILLSCGRAAFQSAIKDAKIRLRYQVDPDSQSIVQRICIVMFWLSLLLLCAIFIPDIGKMIELLVCLAIFLIDNILNSDPSHPVEIQGLNTKIILDS